MSGAEREPIVRSGTAACRYSELAIGDELWDAVTVTEAHVLLAAAVFNDPGPNHINALQAEAGRFGARIAHGPLLIGLMDGALGNVLGSTIVALLEQGARFRHPTFLGDTVICSWRVTAMADKPRFEGGGIVVFAGEAVNGDGTVLAEMDATLAVADRALWDASAHLATRPPDHQRKR
ncbi:MAG TPA: MaoC family dehydratase [Solirubrobacterales bacterium]|nr:MaoC family dehydratase [Solirubrobacterales bacterium]